jgi:hypothetical protein
MKRFIVLLCCMSFALPGQAADSLSDAGLAEVRDLGRLNGVALACGYTDSVTRIKTAIIQHAPKSRRYGAAFEEATNASFLNQAKQDQTTCIDGPTLTSQVDELSQRLQAAVPPAPAN